MKRPDYKNEKFLFFKCWWWIGERNVQQANRWFLDKAPLSFLVNLCFCRPVVAGLGQEAVEVCSLITRRPHVTLVPREQVLSRPRSLEHPSNFKLPPRSHHRLRLVSSVTGGSAFRTPSAARVWEQQVEVITCGRHPDDRWVGSIAYSVGEKREAPSLLITGQTVRLHEPRSVKHKGNICVMSLGLMMASG